MPAVIGVLVDVSASMQQSIGGPVNQEGGSWARSIFRVVDNLIKQDVPSDNQVFAIAYGASLEPNIFDLLNTVEKNEKTNQERYYKREMLEKILDILEENGASKIRSWVSMKILLDVVTDNEIQLFLPMLETIRFRKNFIDKCLPGACKSKLKSVGTWYVRASCYQIFSDMNPNCATQREVEEVIRKGWDLFHELRIDVMLDLLEMNGAPYVRRWLTANSLPDTVADNEIEIFLQMIVKDKEFRRQFVEDCMPDECKHESIKSLGIMGAQFASPLWGLIAPAARENIKIALIESIREAIHKGLSLAWKNNVVEVGPEAIISVDKASKILHGCTEEEKLTNKQVDKLMKTVDPFIYGHTPMIAALNRASELLAQPDCDELQKVLFILSDGEPTDGDYPPVFKDVNIVSCYITNSSISNPKRLYCTESQSWDEGAKFLFRLSSNIQTQHLPRTIFVKRGWKVDITNNQTKLFLQVNHPDLLDEVCSFAKDVVCSQDALSDILASVNLDLYINKANEGFGAKKQKGGTCYANASASVMHLAMKRIVGREGGYPDFFALRQELIDTYGIHGADTLRVLQEVCPLYRLHCKRTDIHGALKAIAEKRPVLARFGLTSEEWHLFDQFYHHNPTGILTDKDLDIQRRPPNAKLQGHAVVLTSFNSEGLNLMNSQGTEWANNGFFSVKNHKILGLEFIDVYWELSDLFKSEIEFYEREGSRISANLLKSLKTLNTATFKCPLCYQVSLVSEFRGKLVHATCPLCHRVFNTSTKDCHDLVLNMYLTSLCREKEESGSAAAQS